MKEFNLLEEMMPYYDKVKNLFYVEDDIKLNFDLTCDWDIYAYDIKTYNNIKVRDIDAWNINAWNIDAMNIDALNINAKDIIADDINANNIGAKEISYHAVCFAYKDIVCDRIKG